MVTRLSQIVPRPTQLILPSHPVLHFCPFLNQRVFCRFLRSGLLVERLGTETRLTPISWAAFSPYAAPPRASQRLPSSARASGRSRPFAAIGNWSDPSSRSMKRSVRQFPQPVLPSCEGSGGARSAARNARRECHQRRVDGAGACLFRHGRQAR